TPTHYLVFLFEIARHHRYLHSFPTRRSSDLSTLPGTQAPLPQAGPAPAPVVLEDVVETDPRYIIGITWPDGVDRYPGLAVLLKRSEEHTSELQSRENLVCRLLLEKKKIEESI